MSLHSSMMLQWQMIKLSKIHQAVKMIGILAILWQIASFWQKRHRPRRRVLRFGRRWRRIKMKEREIRDKIIHHLRVTDRLQWANKECQKLVRPRRALSPRKESKIRRFWYHTKMKIPKCNKSKINPIRRSSFPCSNSTFAPRLFTAGHLFTSVS
jgi:hypothetical protein